MGQEIGWGWGVVQKYSKSEVVTTLIMIRTEDVPEKREAGGIDPYLHSCGGKDYK